MNVLSIGNSFSMDAHRYLYDVAKSDNYYMNVFNLYIGGCSLSTHYRNMLSEENAYILQMNGHSTGFNVSIKEALLNRDWDVITLQQASAKSPYYEAYQPYLNKIAEYVRHLVPHAKIVIHQTWAYEQGCERLNSELGYKYHTEMFDDIKKSYNEAAKDIKADFIIPSGELFQKLLANGIEKVHRDTYHASLGLGRYALGLLWYSVLTGNDVKNNAFSDFDEEIPHAQIEIAKKCVEEVRTLY